MSISRKAKAVSKQSDHNRKNKARASIPRANFRDYGSVVEDSLFAQQREADERLRLIQLNRASA
jgi:hypothetical protein